MSKEVVTEEWEEIQQPEKLDPIWPNRTVGLRLAGMGPRIEEMVVGFPVRIYRRKCGLEVTK